MIQTSEPLAPYTTLHVGGSAEQFARAATVDELEALLALAKKHNWQVRILGGGSNILVSDAGISGLVIKNEIRGITHTLRGDQIEVTVGAGEVFDEVIEKTVAEGWWGLENLSHIPGSVGATPVQNVGAYGVEVKDVIKEVEVFNRDSMQLEVLANQECVFGYRDSIFKTQVGQKYIVTAVTYTLATKPKPVLSYRDLQGRFKDEEPKQSDIRKAVIAIRSKKFPDWHTIGTAGSFFKNPIVSKEVYSNLIRQFPDLPSFPASDQTVKLPLGWILDKVLNLKGVHSGSVGTYQGQALVIVNEGGATATEIEHFAENIVTQVKEKVGIEVEWEVTKW